MLSNIKYLVLLGVLLLIFPVRNLQAQQQTDDERMITRLMEMSQGYEGTVESRKSGIAVKERYLQYLKQKVAEVRESGGTTAALSQLAYSAFLIESRLMAERLKLWQAQFIDSIYAKTDSLEKKKAATDFMHQLRTRTTVTTNDIRNLASRYRPLITNEPIRIQFEMYVKSLDEFETEERQP